MSFSSSFNQFSCRFVTEMFTFLSESFSTVLLGEGRFSSCGFYNDREAVTFSRKRFSTFFSFIFSFFSIQAVTQIWERSIYFWKRSCPEYLLSAHAVFEKEAFPFSRKRSTLLLLLFFCFKKKRSNPCSNYEDLDRIIPSFEGAVHCNFFFFFFLNPCSFYKDLREKHLRF